jgi:beta-glucosidase
MGEGGYKPQWPFGYGLSYTKFEYSNLKVSSNTLKGSGTVKVTVDIKNVGSKAGKEAVELYIRDHFASITPAQKKLKKFKKVSLTAGQTMTVEFELNKSDLAFVGLDSKTWVTEPGAFDIMVGELKATFNYED